MAKISKGYNHYKEAGPAVYIPNPKDGKSLFVLPPGTYKIGQTQQGQIYFEGMSVVTDDLIDLPNTASSDVIDELKLFWSESTREKYKKYGVIHKRGLLLEGAPGTGKSVTLIKVMNMVEKTGGITFFNANPSIIHEAAAIIREIQPDVPLLAIYEEFDEWLSDSSSMLSLLDGEMAIDNLVVLGTTNYIERIPARVKNRPSRFAKVVTIGAPNAATRRKFLQAKLVGDDAKDVEKIVELTKGFVIDQLKDVIVSVYCLGLSIEDAVAKLKALAENGDGMDDIESQEKRRFISEKQKETRKMKEALERMYRDVKDFSQGNFSSSVNAWTLASLNKDDDYNGN